MPEPMTDAQSLAEYSRTRSPEAMGILVRRHVDLVYATARRLVGDAHLAEDVTQAAFIILVKKANRIDPATLPGWLVNTTRLAAKAAIKSKRTRTQYETRAAQMRSQTQTPKEEPTADELLPVLDDALARLSDADRTAVVMRFLQGRSFVEVGGAMGSSEEAARKRVGRAVEKLRSIFMKQGLAPSVGGLMVVLASQQSSNAPAALAAGVTGAVSTGGTAASATIAKAAVSIMTGAQIKLVGILALTMAIAGGLGVGISVVDMARAQSPAGAPTAATTLPTVANFKATLKNGVSLQIVGIREPPSIGKRWLGPDGSTLPTSPYDHLSNAGNLLQIGNAILMYTADQKPWIPQEIAYRMNTKIEGAGTEANVLLTCAESTQPFRGTVPLDSRNHPIKDLLAATVGHKGDAKSTTVRCDVAAGAWMDVCTLDVGPGLLNQMLGGNGVNAQNAIPFSYSYTQTAKRNSLSVVVNYQSPVALEGKKVDQHFVSDLGGGKVFEGDAGAAWQAGPLRTASFDIPANMLPQGEQRLKIQFQIRPYDQWIEFRQVALEADAKSDLQIETSDEQPTTAPATSPSAVGDATLLDQFKSQYPAARAKLETSYSHVKIVGTLTQWDGLGNVEDVISLEEIRNENMGRKISTTVRTTRKIWPEGSVSIEGGTADNYFILSRKAGDKTFTYRQQGPVSKDKFQQALEKSGFARPFATPDFGLGGFLDSANVSLISALPSPDDGPDAVEIVADQSFPLSILRAHLVFQRPSWVLLRWTYGQKDVGPFWEGQTTYVPGSNPPAMKSCDSWFRSTPAIERNRHFLQIDSLTFVKTPPEKFAPDSAISDVSAAGAQSVN